jgi:hypothetical protein
MFIDESYSFILLLINKKVLKSLANNGKKQIQKIEGFDKEEGGDCASF